MKRRGEIRRVEEKNADKEGVSEGQDAVCTLSLEAFSPLSPVAFTDYLFSALYFTFYMHLRCSIGMDGCSLYPTTKKMLKMWTEKITSDFFSLSFV